MNFKTPYNPPNDQTENQGAILLASKLPRHWINHFEGGKLPGVDGMIRIYSEDNHDTGHKIDYQLKTATNENVTYYDLEREVINLCLISRIPTIIFLANETTKQVYWEYIDGYYVLTRLKGKLNRVTNRINFLQGRLVDDPSFSNAIFEICKEHKSLADYDENLNDIEIKKLLEEKFGKERDEVNKSHLRASVLPETAIKGGLTEKIKASFTELEKRCFEYLFYIYLQEPYSPSNKPKLMAEMGLTDEEERLYLGQLEGVGAVQIEDGIVFLDKREEVKTAINEFVSESELKFLT